MTCTIIYCTYIFDARHLYRNNLYAIISYILYIQGIQVIIKYLRNVVFQKKIYILDETQDLKGKRRWSDVFDHQLMSER